jgi:ABC-type protease/lipase transport system fused ATPase/permease subunit
VVIITHRRPILAATDALVVIRDGRLVLQGATAAVLLSLAGPAARPLEAVK